jgi:hypothetical protein
MKYRVFDIPVEGYDDPFKIASLTSLEADVYVNESKIMIERHAASPIPGAEWNARGRETVARALRHGYGTEEWTEARIHAELDLPTIQILLDAVLAKSGLRTGEAAAVSASPKSEAA